MSRAAIQPLKLNQVTIDGLFWGKRLDTNRTVTLKVQYEQSRGRLDAFKLDWKPGQPNQPHRFWDSDVAKWIEASAFSLATHPDAALEKRLNDAVNLIASAQQPDGYLNTHYTVVAPEKRWTDLKDGHEMYCAGHLMEAATAYYEATGNRTLLDVMAKMADHIDSQFGRENGKRRGYCGHPEIELGLAKLAAATGNDRYLQLATYLLDERGQKPHYFDGEITSRGHRISAAKEGHDQHERFDYYQAHKPFREQKDIDGHAVRALYLLSGAIDIARETKDAKLLNVCKRLWRSAVEKRMYITGGVGSRRNGEAFTFDYDLPNETAYAETCASIALAFVAERLLQIEPSNEYGDVLERTLYNGILSGISLSGDRFRYANPLTIHREALSPAINRVLAAPRAEWFDCACCPPNLARVLASLGHYAYSQSKDAVYVHLFATGRATFELGGTEVTLSQTTDYPWREQISFNVELDQPTTFAISLRLPAWCRKPTVKVNGKSVSLNAITTNGYASIRRKWSDGDHIELTLPMPIERVHSNAQVRNNAGKVALQRGPIVYCVEQVDAGDDLHRLVLPVDAPLKAQWEPRLLGGVMTITGKAKRQSVDGDALYSTAAAKWQSVPFKAVPYYAWGNRKVGEMTVWLREGV